MKDTFLELLLDASGSMAAYRTVTHDGVIGFCDGIAMEYRNIPAAITMFKGSRIQHYPLQKLEPVAYRSVMQNYRCDGYTPLYDAVCTAIKRIEEVASGMRVIFAIVTDGEENSSEKYDLSDVKRMITWKQEQGWVFVFMGANHDAWLAGEQIGIRRETIQTFVQAETDMLFDGLMVATRHAIANPDQAPEEFWDAVDATRFGGRNRMTY